MRAIRKDKYQRFADLIAMERAGLDYCRTILPRHSAITVIAPHGGGIELGTSEISKAIAGDQFSLYCFEGLKRIGNKALHITSTNFDDPDCLELTGKSKLVLAVHGCDAKNEVVYVGGSNEGIRIQLISALKGVGFQAQEDMTAHSGRDLQNICNRGLPEGGVQLEIAEGLRKKMFKGLKRNERAFTEPPFDTFVEAVRGSLNRLLFD
jgi:phage replication-related protein YjqB (UPF0714/DUF867 family)